MFAAWQVGAAFTPINPALTPATAAFQVEDSGARVVVHEEPSSTCTACGHRAAALPVTPTRSTTARVDADAWPC